MAVKPVLRGVALLALVASASACGSGHSNATRLTIEVRDDLGVHAWRLKCNPPSGTAPAPKAICGKLRRSPELLAGGPNLGGSPCEPQSWPAFHVSGRYRGYPIEATFGRDCDVLGQKDAYSTWWSLMNGAAGSGVAEQQFTAAVTTHAEQKQRSREEAKALRLRAELHALLARRKAALAAGTFKAFSLEPLDVRIIRDRLELMSLNQGALLASARVYAATRGSLARAFGAPPPTFMSKAPVYEVAVRFAYRDYTGRRRLAAPSQRSFGEEFFGTSIPPIGFWFDPSGDVAWPNFRLLGRPVVLTFPGR